VADDLESDDAHMIPRIKRRDYKQKWQQQARLCVVELQAQKYVLFTQEEACSFMQIEITSSQLVIVESH
jgi:hypothetical protein